MHKGVLSTKLMIKRIAPILVSVGLIFSSCGSGKKPEGEGNQDEKQENRMAMEKLKEIETKNEQIIQILGGPANLEDEGMGGQSRQEQDSGQETQQSPEAQQGQEGQGSKESPEAQQSPEAGQGSESKQDQEGQQEQESKQSPEAQQSPGAEQGSEPQQGQGGQESPGAQESMDPIQSPEAPQQADEKKWSEVSKSIIELHTLFNEYMPDAIKLGAGSELKDNAAGVLNLLTTKAGEKKAMDVLLEANNLYRYICDFYTLHQDKAAPVKLDLYYARRIILAGMVSDWNTADSSIKELKSAWQNHKAMFGEKQKEPAAKLDYSIAETEKVIGEKDMTLVQIKGKLLMQNIAEMATNMEQ